MCKEIGLFAPLVINSSYYVSAQCSIQIIIQLHAMPPVVIFGAACFISLDFADSVLLFWR